MLMTSPPQPIIHIPITLCAIGAILSRPLGHVHVWPLFAPLHSSAALNLAPKMQRSSRNARGKVSSQSFPLATTDLQLWKSHVPRIDRYSFTRFNVYLILIYLADSICRPTNY